MTTKTKTKTKSKVKAKPKRNVLDEYISKTQTEINDRIVSSLKPIYKDSELVTIDDSIHPVLVVLCADMHNGNHNAALDSAATLKIAGLTLKTIQTGNADCVQPTIPDINSLVPIVQNIFGFIPVLSQMTGSLLECLGKNVTQQNEPDIFQFGLACVIGTNLGDPLKSNIMQEIGVRLGYIVYNKYAKTNYEAIQPFLKQLPRNKYAKRMKELIDKLYAESQQESIQTKDQDQDQEPQKISVQVTTSTYAAPSTVSEKQSSQQQKEKEPESESKTKEEKETDKSENCDPVVETEPIKFATKDDE